MTDPREELAVVLRQFDEDGGPLDDHDVLEAVEQFRRREVEAGLDALPDAVVECAAFMFCPNYTWRGDGWGSYYGPMWASVTADGKAVYNPDIEQFDATTFVYWGKRANEARHPVLRIRYADLCWEFQRKRTGNAPRIETARIVIDSTIEATTRRLVRSETGGITKLARAMTIALAVRDNERIDGVRDAIVSYEDAVARDDAPGICGFSYDLILENAKVPKSPELESKIITDLEGRLGRLTAVQGGKPVDAWGAQDAAVRLATHYRRREKTSDVRRVLTLYGAAFGLLAETASGTQAAGWLQNVHGCYRQFGLLEEASALLFKIREFAKKSHGEMAVHLQKMEVPVEEMEKFLNGIVHGDLSSSLNRLAFNFLPKKERIIGQIEDIRKAAPLMSLLPMTLVEREGRPTSTIGGVEDDMQGRIAYHVSQNMQLSQMFLSATINRIRERFSPTGEDLLCHLCESPAFPEEHHRTLLAGMEAYLANDHLVTAHLLVPQFEATIRRLLDIAGGNLWKAHRGGGLMLKNLDDLLREKIIENCLTEDGVLCLRVLLTDQRGWNLRNQICHALTPAASFGRGMTDRLLHGLLVLGLLRKQSGGERPKE